MHIVSVCIGKAGPIRFVVYMNCDATGGDDGRAVKRIWFKPIHRCLRLFLAMISARHARCGTPVTATRNLLWHAL